MSRFTATLLGVTIVATATLASGCGSSVANTSAPPNLSDIPVCAPSQLRMTYFAGGLGTGNNFGTIAVLNNTDRACVWSGGLSVSPLTNSQQFMDNSPPITATAHRILLSAHGYVAQSALGPAGDHWGEIVLMGNARDDPNGPNAMCARANEVSPAYWGIATLEAKFTVANYDSHPLPSRNFFHGVTSCHGHFEVVAVEPSP